jgi:transitional endoplasmic reticulum ATPase
MILVRGPEILSKWVGESEKAIREIFRKAKTSSPCIIIFDELDSLARFKSNEEGGIGERLLSQLLTEMEDGGASRVIVLGISNRPDLIDPSLIRPGRLDLMIFVPPPDEKGRFEIIRLLTKQMPLSGDIDLKEIAVTTKGYSGADLVAVCREAAVNAMRNSSPKISNGDFSVALKNVKPSITKGVEDWYLTVKDNISYALPKPMDKAFYG